MKRLIGMIAFLVAGAAALAPASAQTPFRSTSTNALGTGVIDWVEGYIEATGYGVAPETGNIAQEELLAMEAARVIAYQRLAELMNGVEIKAQTAVENIQFRRSAVIARVEAFIKGATIVDQSVEYISRPGRPEALRGKVTIRVCMNSNADACRGQGGGGARQGVYQILQDAIKAEAGEPSAVVKASLSAPAASGAGNSAGPTASDAAEAAPTRTASAQAPAPSDPSLLASGLILNLGGKFAFNPVLNPEIIRQDGTVLYSAASLTDQALVQNGPLQYANSVETARKIPLLGEEPKVLTVSGVNPDNQLVLNDESADRLVKMLSLAPEIFREGKIALSYEG